MSELIKKQCLVTSTRSIQVSKKKKTNAARLKNDSAPPELIVDCPSDDEVAQGQEISSEPESSTRGGNPDPSIPDMPPPTNLQSKKNKIPAAPNGHGKKPEKKTVKLPIHAESFQNHGQTTGRGSRTSSPLAEPRIK